MNSPHKTVLAAACAILGLSIATPDAVLGGIVRYYLRFDQSEYVVPPGSTIELKMYFDEVADTPSDHRLANSNRHLGSASVKIAWSGGHSYVASVDDLTFGSGFNEPPLSKKFLDPQNGIATLIQSDMFPPYSTWTQISDTPSSIRRVQIGTVSFTAANTPGDVTQVVLSDQDSQAEDFSIVDAADFTYYFSPDGQSTLTAFTATIRTSGTAVPEPGGTALLTVLAAMAVGAWRSRSRRRLA